MNQRRACRNHFGAQRAYADKSASGQLKVFGYAAIKFQALVRVASVYPLHGVTSTKEAFIVKTVLGSGFVSPVAGGDVGAAVAHFGFVAFGYQL